jgi:hypothetical protein
MGNTPLVVETKALFNLQRVVFAITGLVQARFVSDYCRQSCNFKQSVYQHFLIALYYTLALRMDVLALKH